MVYLLSDEEDHMSDPSQDKPADAPASAVEATPPADADPAPAPAPAPAAEAGPASAAPTEASAPAVAVEEPAHQPAPKEEPPKKEAHGKHKKEAHAAKQPEPEPEPAPAPAPSPPRAVAPSSARGKLLLVAWSGSPAGGWADGLRQAGYDVYVESGARASAFQWASTHQPVAAVIDLSTMPEDGQRLASTLRITAATAGIPVVFSQASGAGSHPAQLDDVLARLSRL
jgi:outer membrane biosynthesis protein TonB